jgi:hypothetical protein
MSLPSIPSPAYLLECVKYARRRSHRSPVIWRRSERRFRICCRKRGAIWCGRSMDHAGEGLRGNSL